MPKDHHHPARTAGTVGLFTVACGGATYAVYQMLHWPFGAGPWAVILFLGALTAVLLLWQERALVLDPKGFMMRFMAGLVVKLLAGLAAVAAILVLLPRDQGLRLSLTFAALYLAFLAFSTVRLSRLSRNPGSP